jgi:membrane glycosyltransferase
LLFLPKALSLLLIFRNRQAQLFGGIIALCASIVLEIFVSTLLAPVRMWFHSKFVLVTLMGRQIKWGPQCRTDNETRWADAFRLHGFSTLFALGWIGSLFWLNPQGSAWLLPIATALILSTAISVLSSRASLGGFARRWRLFLIPEELDPPQLIQDLQSCLVQRRRRGWEPKGFVRAAVDSDANAVHLALLRGKTPKSPDARARNRSLQEKILKEGPHSLNRSERAYLLRDAAIMAALRESLWHSYTSTQTVLPRHQTAETIEQNSRVAARAPELQASEPMFSN